MSKRHKSPIPKSFKINLRQVPTSKQRNTSPLLLRSNLNTHQEEQQKKQKRNKTTTNKDKTKKNLKNQYQNQNQNQNQTRISTINKKTKDLKNKKEKEKEKEKNENQNTFTNLSDEEIFDAQLEGISIGSQSSSESDLSGSDSSSDLENEIKETKLISNEFFNENNNQKSKNELELLDGEIYIHKEDNVKFLMNENSTHPIPGVLMLTNYRLFFNPYEFSLFIKSYQQRVEIYLGTIQKIIKFGGSKKSRGELSYGIEIVSKEFRDYKFYFLKKGHRRRTMYNQILKYAFQPIKKCYSILHKKNNNMCIDSGWEIYYPFFEFKRQGLFENAKWTISDSNEKWKICPTYPRELPVPSTITLKDLHAISKFRSKGRLPVLSYYYRKNLTTITRSSQPRVGLTRSRCVEDEKLLKEISATTEKDQLLILDCRPKKNALANMGRHGGFEILSNYGNCTLEFLGIENIHAMRDSLSQLKTLVNQSMDDGKKWLSGLEDTMWIFHIQKILEGSIQIVDSLHNKAISVLVHCSDGWDRTAQTCSLSQIMLDPYFRTIRGFEILIIKEWLGYGHKFHQRIGHFNKHSKDTQRSPVFLQFIDCVYQIFRQFPAAFQFNEDFLIFILEHLFSLRFGTFFYNSNRERIENDINRKTYSLWTHINENKDIFTNPNYKKMDKIITPSISTRSLAFWENYYMKSFLPLKTRRKRIGRHITKNSKKGLSELIYEKEQNKLRLLKQNKELKLKIEKLRKEEKNLKKLVFSKKK
ncbi:myotubularin-related [Anaeramoeba flamelloides]|uniref:phosphatidylinositol-3,5-bisphosphate 3-phosphatase n=1 Tax=Anaeramoeba flamelloides TaxID=1746091 RepID=A0AAV7ZPC8_9EUKA|nr:myotubularin-related [Anaeramoeba flamelloides]